jgi:aerobic carbon-monoxide dehydrogenase medium subunit
VKPPPFDYARPETLAEVVDLRAQHSGDSVLLAGGQSLLPLLNFRLARPSLVIDLGSVPELAYIEERDGGIAVGAMNRQRDLELHDRARELNPLIAATLVHVAHGVVRNRGTVGGSIAHADASAELPALFTALDGRARVRCSGGEREIVGGDLFVFHMTSALQPDEVLREVWFPPLPADTGYAFVETARRHGDYALCGVCATVTLGERISAARLAYSGVATRPVRAHEAEQALVGQAPSDDVLAAAARAAREVVGVGDDYVASRDYRRHLTERLTLRALREAVGQAPNHRGQAFMPYGAINQEDV